VWNMLYGHKVRLVGPPGCGKTEVCPAICATLGVPYMPVSFREDQDSTDLAGDQGLSDGEKGVVTTHQSTDLMRFYSEETGTRVIQFNELSRAKSKTLMLFQSAWDSSKYIELPGKRGNSRVYEGAGLIMCATDNTLGMGDDLDKYSAANVLDGSTLDRWDVTLQWKYLSPNEEKELLQKWQPVLSDALARKLVQFVNLCRDGFNQGDISIPVSPRMLRTIGNLTAEWRNPVQAIKTVVYNAVPTEEQDGVREYVKTIGFDRSYGSL